MKKKVILVIVEGPSDQTALAPVFVNIFKSDQIEFRIVHGDLTIDSGVNQQNAAKKLGSIVKGFRDLNHLKNKDFKKVIFISDTDGVYCEPEAVIEKPGLEHIRYSETSINCSDREAILERNEKKAAILNRISGLPFVLNDIPFEAYYMSCNLDHVTQNKLNLRDDEKSDYSFAFAEEYQENPTDRYSVFAHTDIAVLGTQSETWEFIRQGNRSLERHSNLINCLKDD